MKIRFTKMQGAANDFIVLDNRDMRLPEETLSALARQLCPRRFAVGADGLMAVETAEAGGDFRMRFFNSDGSIGEMCGNGARCIARFGYMRGAAGPEMVIETTAGPVRAWRLADDLYKVRLNDVTRLETDMCLPIDGKIWHASYVELGDPPLPHLAVPYAGLQETAPAALRPLGAALRAHPALPKGANVNFYEVQPDGTVFERTFERGVEDFTYACGTGTASVAAVVTETGQVTDPHVVVDMAGGRLTVDVERRDGRISALYLSGPATVVYEGEADV